MMKMKRNAILLKSLGLSLICAAGLTSHSAFAKCGAIEAKGEINIIGNSFPALQHIAKEMESCSAPGLKVQFKMTPQARTEIETAFSSNGKSPFDAAVVAMGVYANLQSKNQLLPLTKLVEKYKAKYKLEENMLVKVNGEVMAIAFMSNAQSLYYRKDLFDKHGIKAPTNYPEMVQAAATLKAKEPSIEFPIAQTFAQGFDVATEFTNMYRSLGGSFFKQGSAQPAFNDAIAVQTLTLMKSMMPYMTPNAFASNSDDVMNQFQQGRAAMGVLWASRAARMDDPAASKIVGKMEFAAAPAAKTGAKPASHLWWDGVVIPKNHSGNAEAIFQVLMEALDEETTAKGNDTAVWIRSIYKPGRFGSAVSATGKAGAPIWPTEPYFNLAHAELGKVIPDALSGRIPMEKALDNAAAAYVSAAKEKGFIK
jgi:multiple sugar transport system substrate-binding protein